MSRIFGFVPGFPHWISCWTDVTGWAKSTPPEAVAESCEPWWQVLPFACYTIELLGRRTVAGQITTSYMVDF
jgi:hypothetical protein